MEMSITSEMISQKTIGGDNGGYNDSVDNSEEQIELEKTRNNLNKAREIYFKYFSSQRMARTKATVQSRAMMGVPLAHSVAHTKQAGKKGKGQIPKIGLKQLDWVKPKLVTKVTKGGDFDLAPKL